MISPEISERIVSVGVSPVGRGGMASVIAEMQKMMRPYNFLKIQQAGYMKYILPLTGLFRAFKYAGKRYKIAHIHSASFIDFYRNSIYVLLFKLMGKKVILHMHGSKFEEFYGDGKPYVKYICRRCDAMATVSNYFVKMLKERGLNDNVWLVHNDLPNPIVLRDETGKDKGHGVQFVFLGLVSDKKGTFAVLDAIAGCEELREKGIKFKIGGNGEIERLQKEVREKGLEDIVEYCGWVGPEDKDRLLRESDVYIMPSEFESFGISTLEAMGYSLPVITTGVGGVPDLVTDGYNGIIVEAGNSRQIAQAMLRLADSPGERKRMGKNSALHAENFRPEKIEAQLTEMYKSLL